MGMPLFFFCLRNSFVIRELSTLLSQNQSLLTLRMAGLTTYNLEFCIPPSSVTSLNVAGTPTVALDTIIKACSSLQTLSIAGLNAREYL